MSKALSLLIIILIVIVGMGPRGFSQERVQTNQEFDLESSDFYKEFKLEVEEQGIIDQETLQELNALASEINRVGGNVEK